ncbi:hypothetical protein ACI2UC_14595 [Ralstonia nicotianae]|uniref:Uncharacterized protein n=1 Tax=Ralstonia syzygii TaxID=28097 RepID=A0ABX7ZAS9_9RALS|nr:hypothetical protein [Ralstonia syzygii]QUP52422.1 hypothetical protein GO998_00885 [Ralstonia syzygii]
MSSLALSRCNGPLSGLGSPPAGDVGRSVLRQALVVVDDLKVRGPARTSWVFNDLYALAEENGLEIQQTKVFTLAQRFLLALPAGVGAPELSLDVDGEVCFDWQGPGGKLMTVTLREDGRLSYASRMSQYDKDHGVKQFLDAIPKSIVDLLHQVTTA